MNDHKELINHLRYGDYRLNPDPFILNTKMLEWADQAADVIEQLVKERDKLKLDLCEANDVIEYVNDKLKKVTKERDFIYDYIPRQCNTCGNYVCTVDSFGINSYGCDKGGCADWKRKENWEWRGVQE